MLLIKIGLILAKVWHQLKYSGANIGPPTALKKLFVISGLAHAFTLGPLIASAHYVVCPSKATKAGKEKAAEIAAAETRNCYTS